MIKDKDDHLIKLDNEMIYTLKLDPSLSDEVNNQLLKGLSHWYYETKNLEEATRLSLVNQNPNKEIDTYVFQ